MKCVPLASGGEIPIVGLGTWQATAQEVEDAITIALDLGYRHIDTAFNYNNEEAIGNALNKWFAAGKDKREDVFVTSKLPHIGNRAKDVSRFLKMSLDRLKLNYLDLYLIHMPFGFVCDECTLTPVVQANGEFEIDPLTDHLATWKAMEEQVRAGFVKHIGLSNFNSQQIQRVYDNATIKPSVLQVELHAYLQQMELRALCKQLNIVITAYSPLGSPAAKSHFQNKYNFEMNEFPNILGHPVVLELVNKYKKSAAQILLTHLVQQNIVVIPKSANATRIAENLNVFDFELTEEDIGKLDTIDRGEQGRIFNFLFFKGIDKHPEYPFARLNDSC